MFTAQLMDTGAHGQDMEVAVLHAEKDTNTERENVWERHMMEKIALGKQKNP